MRGTGSREGGGRPRGEAAVRLVPGSPAPRARNLHTAPCCSTEVQPRDHSFFYMYIKETKYKIANNCNCICRPQASNLGPGPWERAPSSKREGGHHRGREDMRHKQSSPLGPRWIQRGPVQLGPGRSGTRAWPEAGTQAAGHGPQWPRHRGGQPEPTGAGSTGGWKKTPYPGTGQRERRELGREEHCPPPASSELDSKT